MKKFSVTLVLILMLIVLNMTLTGCGSSKPSGIYVVDEVTVFFEDDSSIIVKAGQINNHIDEINKTDLDPEVFPQFFDSTFKFINETEVEILYFEELRKFNYEFIDNNVSLDYSDRYGTIQYKNNKVIWNFTSDGMDFIIKYKKS